MKKENFILGWNIEEIKSLILAVKGNTNKNLLKVFEEYAKNTNRNTFSVRNFYYRLIEETNVNKDVSNILEKNGLLKLLKTNHFSESETEKLLYALLKDEGISVRRACRKLAKNDEKLSIRMQNKYRNALKTQPELVSKILEDLRSKNIKTRNVSSNNILELPKQTTNTISQQEIQALFMGLVRLVKKSAQEEFECQLVDEVKSVNNQLQNSLIDLRRKEILVAELQEQNKILTHKLKLLENNLSNTQNTMLNHYSKINNLVSSDRMEELKNFIDSLVKKETQKGEK
ncbi:MAG: hypothetical protein J6C13_03815 [Clostridia bacterium]|nr:hypothetical protein [Clostridia bacterium]